MMLMFNQELEAFSKLRVDLAALVDKHSSVLSL